MEEHKGLKHSHVAENVVFIWFVEVEKLLKTLISLALFAQHGLFFQISDQRITTSIFSLYLFTIYIFVLVHY